LDCLRRITVTHRREVRDVLLHTELEGIPLYKRGKVRDLYDLGSHLLVVATDRISAFDVVLPNGIPGKGWVLTQLSKFWFERTRGIVQNHFVSADFEEFPPLLRRYQKVLDGRSMVVKKAVPLPVECVVRGYLSGSALREYRDSGLVCGISLRRGLRESERLDEPIFTPTTKASSGHDESLTHELLAKIVGGSLAGELLRVSLQMYDFGRNLAEERGVIVADTKFEFGTLGGELLLIDELLTPDSSRFWPRESYEPGTHQQSFDKQPVRDYLEGLKWDKSPPAPELPPEIVEGTSQRYLEIHRRLTS